MTQSSDACSAGVERVADGLGEEDITGFSTASIKQEVPAVPESENNMHTRMAITPRGVQQA